MWWQSWRARVGNKLGNETWDNVNSLAAAELCGESLAPSAMTNTSWPDRLATISSQRDFFFQTYLFGCVSLFSLGSHHVLKLIEEQMQMRKLWIWQRKCTSKVKQMQLQASYSYASFIQARRCIGSNLEAAWRYLGEVFFGPQGLLLLNALHNVTALALMHLLHISDDSICFLNMKMKLLGIE